MNKAHLAKGFLSLMLAGGLLFGGFPAAQAEDAAAPSDGIKRLEATDFETLVIGHFDYSHGWGYDTRPYLTNGYREQEAERRVKVEAVGDEQADFTQKWKITYNDKGFWMDGNREAYKGNDYNSGGFKENPFFGLLLSDDLELVGDAKITIHGRVTDTNTPRGEAVYEGPLETKLSQEYWTDSPYQNANYGRLQGAIRMDRIRNLTTGQDNLADLQEVLNDQRENNAFFRFGRINYDVPNRGSGGAEAILNDVGLIYSTYLYTSKEYEFKSTWMTMEITTKRDPGRFYEGDHATFVAGLYNSYAWNGKDVRVYSKEYHHRSDVDTDGDGLPDRLEYFLGSNPLNKNSDGDDREDGVEIRDKTQPLLEKFDGLYKVHGTDPMIAPPTLPDRKFFGIPGEIIEGTATPNSVIAIYPYANGERSDEALAEAIADKDGHYKLVIGQVFERQKDYNQWNNTIVLEEGSDEGNFVPKMKYRKPNIPAGSTLELTSWSDGFDGRPLFSHPELAKERGELVDLDRPFEDLDVDPKVDVKDPDHLSDEEKGEIKDKIVNHEDLVDVIKGDTPEERGENVKVNENGSVEVTLKDDTVVVVPPKKVINNPATPKAELTLTPKTPAAGQENRPAEGTDITVGGHIVDADHPDQPVKNREVTVVVTTGKGSPQEIPARTNENGDIVDRTTGQPITVTAGNFGEVTEVKLYDGDDTSGQPLAHQSVTAGRDPEQVNVPVFDGDKKSTVTVTQTPVLADGKSSATVTVKLVNKYGDPIRQAGDKIKLSLNEGTADIGQTQEGTNGTYTLDLTSTTPGQPSVKVVYNDKGETEIPGSPLKPTFMAKPQAPQVDPLTEGAKTVVVTPQGDDVTKITLVVPGNGTIVLTKDEAGDWKASGDATVQKDPSGAITVTVPKPISVGKVTAVATNAVGDSDPTSVDVATLTPEVTLTLKPQNPVEGTEVTVEGKVEVEGQPGTPLVNRPLTVVVEKDGQTQEIEAKTDENGNIVDRDTGEKITIPAGDAGTTTTVKVYDGDTAKGEPLATSSVTAVVDPEKGVPNLNDGDKHHSTVEASGGPVPADGTSSYTITVTLVDKQGNPVTGQAGNITLSSDGQGVTISNVTEGAGGTYTATVTATQAGNPQVNATYGTPAATIPGSPLTLQFDEVATPSKPVAPKVDAPTVGDTTVTMEQPGEDVTKIMIRIPGNGVVNLTKNDDGTWKADKPGVTAEVKDGKLVITVPTPITSGQVTGLVTDKNNNSSEPFSVDVIENETPVDPSKPVVPKVETPTVGDESLTLDPPAEDVTKIVAEIPGNGTVTIVKDADGTWKADKPGVTVETGDEGKLVIKLPNPIEAGTVTVTVEDKDSNKSVPKTVEVTDNTDPVVPSKPVAPGVTAPSVGDESLTLDPPAEDVMKIVAEIPGNGTVTIVKDADGNWSVPGNGTVTVTPGEGGKLVIGGLTPITPGTVTVIAKDEDDNESVPKTVEVTDNTDPVVPSKPVVPDVTAPSVGDESLTLDPPAEDVTKIVAEIPGNGTVTIVKDADGTWKSDKPGVTVETGDEGKLVIKLPNPIEAGTVTVTVEDKDSNKSVPKTVEVIGNTDPSTGAEQGDKTGTTNREKVNALAHTGYAGGTLIGSAVLLALVGAALVLRKRSVTGRR